VVYRL